MKRGLHPVFHNFPVDDFPKVGEVFRASVLVVQVVSMFPDIEAQQWFHTLSDRVASVGFLDDDQFSVLVLG